MAENQSTIALNIGSQRISMAVFEPSKSGKLVLKGYETEEYLVDPSLESSRVGQIRTAIGELAERLKARGKVRYAISGHSAFIRFVKLPPLDDDNIEQLVTFEAQQHVPFPLEEVVWDYEILEIAGEKEAAIVAIKADALDEINEAVNASGLGTAEIDVAPMALYNAFLAAYPDVTESVLLIDIGAKTSDLLYIEGRRFFTRSAAVGGGAVTAAISKEFNVGFGEAELHKVQSGMVALGGGHTEQLDESTAALAMTIRNAIGRLATEVPRTTNYFRSQHNGSAPKRVYLAGGGANLPYAKEFFEEKLKLPVEYFNPLAAISIGKEVDAEVISKEAHRMGEVIGLGLRGMGRSRLHIDLVPAAVGEAREAERRKPFLVAAAACLMLGTALWAFFNLQAASGAREEAADKAAQLATLRTPAEGIQKLQSRQERVRSIAGGYIAAEGQRTFWLDALQELNEALASETVWVVDLVPLVGYDPLDESKPGQEVVKKDFAKLAFGVSAMESIRVGARVPQNPARNQGAPVPMANAVRIRGFWRKPSTQNVVYELLKNLRANVEEGGSHFQFTVRKDGKEVVLEEKQLAPAVEAAPAPEEFAAPFELVLPLAREVPIQ